MVRRGFGFACLLSVALAYSRVGTAATFAIDYVMAQPSGKAIKESPGATAVRGEAPKPKRKPKTKEQPPEQLRLF